MGNRIDKSNSRIDPTDGWFFSNSIGLAGIGGDKKYIKINSSLASYDLIFNEKVTLSLIGKTGYILGLGQNIEISDKLFWVIVLLAFKMRV